MPKKQISFEDALAEMEKIIDLLESDDVSLSDALNHFERGVSLMRLCDSHLKSAEGKFTELTKGENGKFFETLLSPQPDAPGQEGPDNE